MKTTLKRPAEKKVGNQLLYLMIWNPIIKSDIQRLPLLPEQHRNVTDYSFSGEAKATEEASLAIASNTEQRARTGSHMGMMWPASSKNWRYINFRQIVPYVSDNYAYSQTLASLQANTNYYIQIQVLDRNSYVLYVTSEILTKSGQECSHRKFL